MFLLEYIKYANQSSYYIALYMSFLANLPGITGLTHNKNVVNTRLKTVSNKKAHTLKKDMCPKNNPYLQIHFLI